MKSREVISYIFNCIFIIALILIGISVDYDKYNNKYLQERIEELEEDQINLNMQLAIKELPELVKSESGEDITKEERIEELELILVTKTAVLIESYEFIDALESHITILKQIMELNEIIYPEFVYIKIEK